jgi:hypothetical protein
VDANRPIMKIVDVYSALREEKPIENVTVTEIIDLEKLLAEKSIDHNLPFEFPVIFKNCYIKSLCVPLRTCTKRFSFENCVMVSVFFMGCYLIEGISIKNCTFYDDIYLFCAGGHNKPDWPVIIEDTTFYGLVDFQDAWFQGPVRITRCNFVAGTNLLGNLGHSDSVHFDYQPELESNTGKLDMNGSFMDWKFKPIERPKRKIFLWF